MDEVLKTILVSEYGEEAYETIVAGLDDFSSAIRHITPCNSDQYGAMRVGPAYPFNLSDTIRVQRGPVNENFLDAYVIPRYHNYCEPNQTPTSARIHDEINSIKKSIAFMEEGMAKFETVSSPNEKFLRLKNMCQFILNSTRSCLRAKEWHVLICRMNVEPTKEGLSKIYDEMEELLLAEIKTVEATIPLVEADSRLGWEPRMGYLADRWHLEWKIRQVRHVIENDIGEYRRCIKL